MNNLINQTQSAATDKQRYVMETIADMINSGINVSVQSVATRCKVSRNYIYRHSEILRVINICRVSNKTKAELRQEVIRLRLKIRDLERLLNQEG